LPDLTYPLPKVLGDGSDDEVDSAQLDLTILQSACGSAMALFALPFPPDNTDSEQQVNVRVCPVSNSNDNSCKKTASVQFDFVIHGGCPTAKSDQHLVQLPTRERRRGLTHSNSAASKHLLILNCGDMLRFVEFDVAFTSNGRREESVNSQPKKQCLEDSHQPPASPFFPPRVQLVSPDVWWDCAAPLEITHEDERLADQLESSPSHASSPPAYHPTSLMPSPSSSSSSSSSPTLPTVDNCYSMRALSQSSFEAEPFVVLLLQGVLKKLNGGHASVLNYHLRVVDPLFRPPRSGGSHCSHQTSNDDDDISKDNKGGHDDFDGDDLVMKAALNNDDDDGVGRHVLVCIVVEVGSSSPRTSQGRDRTVAKEQDTCPDRATSSTAGVVRVGVCLALEWRTGLAAVLRTARLDSSAPPRTDNKRSKNHAGSTAKSHPQHSSAHLLAGFVFSCRAAFAPSRQVSALSSKIRTGVNLKFSLSNTAVLHDTSMPCLLNSVLPVGVAAAAGRS
jgi:hypothetical protein